MRSKEMKTLKEVFIRNFILMCDQRTARTTTMKSYNSDFTLLIIYAFLLAEKLPLQQQQPNQGKYRGYGRGTKRRGYEEDLDEYQGQIFHPTQQLTTRNTLSQSISQFSIALYKQAEPSVDTGGNKFISPFSVLAALMFTMLGTTGNTEKQLMSTLQLNGIQTNNVHQEYKVLQDFLNNDVNRYVTLTIANRIFLKLGVNVNPKYQLDAKRYYESGVEALDFAGNPEGSRLRINKWAENKTNNLIKEILPKGTVNRQAVMFLLNAIYFKGDWALQFDKNKTEKKDFYVSATKTEKVDMMTIETKKLRSGVNKQFDCKILEMPYKGNDVSMVIILPNKINGLPYLENQLSTTTLEALYSSLKKQKTTIAIPKFEMLTNFKLKKPLQELGITDLFDPFTADLSGMFNPPSRGLHVSSVVHKAFIKVDEEGTEAAAVTVIGVVRTSLQLPMTFVADHPFLFLIREKQTGTILFMGRYTKPPK